MNKEYAFDRAQELKDYYDNHPEPQEEISATIWEWFNKNIEWNLLEL